MAGAGYAGPVRGDERQGHWPAFGHAQDEGQPGGAGAGGAALAQAPRKRGGPGARRSCLLQLLARRLTGRSCPRNWPSNVTSWRGSAWRPNNVSRPIRLEKIVAHSNRLALTLGGLHRLCPRSCHILSMPRHASPLVAQFIHLLTVLPERGQSLTCQSRRIGQTDFHRVNKPVVDLDLVVDVGPRREAR
jgi:hypothetical protein